MKPLIEFKQISYSYQSPDECTNAIENLSFHVNKGEFISVIGPSGCGKSTLLSMIAGLIQPDSGSIEYSEELYASHPIRPIGYLLHNDALVTFRIVYRNCFLGLEIYHALTEENLTYTRSLLEEYGLMPFADRRPTELSGGMRQRAALIRTLVLRPELLLLDEPFSSLDYQTRLTVSDDICSKIRSEGKTTILVTHDLAEAISLSDRVIVLTKRPATLRKEFLIRLTRDSEHRFSSREAPEFQSYFHSLWEALYET